MSKLNFEDFLKSYDADARYLINKKEEKCKELFNLSFVEPEDWILEAFDWEDSNEGVNYWDSLDDAWRYNVKLSKHIEFGFEEIEDED